MSSNKGREEHNHQQRHPLEKSLAIFPLVPRSKINLASSPFSSSNCSITSYGSTRRRRAAGANRSADSSNEYNRILVDFSRSFSNSTTNKKTKSDQYQPPSCSNAADDSNFQSTKRKLDAASKYLPKRQAFGDPLTFKLPPIASSRPSLILQHSTESNGKPLFEYYYFASYFKYFSSW